MAGVQFQIRQNAMEMQEYVKDLFEWQHSIKKKEKARAADPSAPAGVPAPRGRATGSVAAAPAELMKPALGPASTSGPPKALAGPSGRSGPSAVNASTQPSNAAAHTYTAYSKWDKFDVDAALESDEESSNVEDRVREQPTASAGASVGAATGQGRDPVIPPAPPATATPPSAASPAPERSGIQLTAQDPSTSGEDLLKPVSTTRLAPRPAPAAESAPGPTPSTSQPAPLPPIRNAQPTTPDAWRTRGNDLFKAGEYDSAYECYSRSLEMQPTCLAYANRAMALLKLSRWQEAADDCTAALALDPAYVKALQRRAAAHRSLGQAEAAARDWEAALRLEPENKATAADRDAAVEGLLRAAKLAAPAKRTAVPVTWAGPALVPATAARPAAAQAVAVGSVQAAGQAEAVRGRGAGDLAGGEAGPGTAAGVGAEEEQAPAQAGEATAGARPGRRLVVEEEKEAEAGAASGGAQEHGPSGLTAAAQAPPLAVADRAAAGGTASTSVPAAAGTPAAAAGAAAAAVAAAAAAAAAAAVSRGVPRTSVEFEAAWRSHSGDASRQAAYVAAIPPATLPTVFKNSLTAPVLSAILRCLLARLTAPPQQPAGAADGSGGSGSGSVTAAAAVATLEGMAKVARFDLMAMSVPSRERGELKAAWAEAEAALKRRGEADSTGGEAAGALSTLAALRPKYRM
ncbi:hypothetical protein HYH03_012015 [Edaphochlamys debaryana]|uniref:RNA-polymerase II-associated protein 3-like C-terminal domain-containing protein n=1 Tax=Edaphochlamys debaryana TaxID=47281 RepID=A0A836BVZ5_9CHLO|nr:hypothetical protein HYH03_012015 [Edaphochlamys debaryana]|eukprot:KAG2489564.1 hypothetical protein HYH03_012015 [Edaphochlamys debaryana]